MMHLRALRIFPDLALAESVAVALVVVAGDTGTEKVSFDVASHPVRASVAFEDGAETALTAREVQFGGVRLGCAWVGGGVERRIDVRVQGALTPYRFKREEGDW